MEIHIDPANEPRRVLLALAAMLTTLANGQDGQLAPADRPDAGTDAVVLGPTIRTLTGEGKLAAPAQVFGSPPCSTDLAAAFGGAGNGAASSVTVFSPPPAANAAGSPTIPIPISAPAAASPGPDLAAAFGGNSALPNGVPGVPAPNAAPAPPANLPPPGTPPAPGNGASTAGVELDTDGLPWHSEIHSSNKKKSATGKWMARRNVSPVTLARVTGELRAAVSVGNAFVPTGTAPPPPPSAIPTPMPSPGTTPAPAAYSPITLAVLLPRITAAMGSGQLTADATATIAMELSGGQINNVAMLAVAPQLVPAFWDRLDQLGVAR